MWTKGDEWLGHALARCVRTARSRPLAVIALAAAATVLALAYTVSRLGVQTDTSAMFSEDLAFRREWERFQESFPQFADVLLVVVDAQSAERSIEAATALAQALEREPELFRSVYLPAADPFFREHGLLYLPTEDVRELAAGLKPIAPFLSWIERDPSLERLADTLRQAVAFGGAKLPPELTAVVEGLGRSLEAEARGEPWRFSWSGAFLGGSPLAGTRQLLLLQPRLDFASFLPGEPAIERVRERARELGFGPGSDVEVRLTGEVALVHEELESARRGALVAGALSLLLVGSFLTFGLRSPRMVLASLAVLVAGLIWTSAWAAFAVGHLNLISIAFAVLYIGLGVDHSLHVALRYRELVIDGLEHGHALDAAAEDVGGSLLLASLTTALGFLAFVPTDFAGVGELGLIAGPAMLISLFANATLLPALLSFGPTRPRLARGAGHAVRSIGVPLGGPLGHFLLHRPHAVRVGALVLGVAAALSLAWARFDPNPLSLRDPRSESVVAYEALARDPATTPYRASVFAAGPERTAELARRLAALEPVGSVLSLHDLVPAGQEAKLEVLLDLAPAFGASGAAAQPASAPAGTSDVPGEAPEDTGTAASGARARSLEALRGSLERLADSLGEDPRAADIATSAERIGAFTAFLERLPPKERSERLDAAGARLLGGLPEEMERFRAMLRTEPVALADIPAEVSSRWIAPDGRWRVEAVPASDLSDAAELRRFVEAVRTVDPAATGGPIVLLESGRVAVQAFRRAMVFALAAITLVLLLVLRSPRDVARVLAPLLLAGALTGAAFVVTGIGFNFANVIALPLLLGIGVAHGVFMMHRQFAAPPVHRNLLLTSTARAVLFSSLTTLGGFGTLALSPHPGTASLGILLSLGVALTLACTLVVLPALLTSEERGFGAGRELGKEAA